MSQSSLAVKDQERFSLLEKICIAGRVTFFVVGQALQEIKVFKFYESKGFKSFDSYCESIGYTRRHANQLVASKAAVESLPESMQKLITTEGAARELAKLPEAIRAAVVHEISEQKKPVTRVEIKKLAPPPPRPEKPAPAEKRKGPPERIASSKVGKVEIVPKSKAALDKTGIEIPKEIEKLWFRWQDAQAILTYISAIRGSIRKAQESHDILFAEVNFNSAMSAANQLYEDMKTALPYAVCPTCNGVMSKGCMACKERGFVSEFYWNTCVPEETRKMRNGK